jgi:EAL domain-containing protein (putative c-di-GMP-specific phosphodiesterase class I)
VQVVAEGIETVEQADMLLQRGCSLGQGYLYSKALPPNEIKELLLRRSQEPTNAPIYQSAKRRRAL